MPPSLQIYNNDKYGKWMLQFWLKMGSLTQEQDEYMSQGLFSQSLTVMSYSCLPLDLWIEMTMNKGSKMKSGWVYIYILKNEKLHSGSCLQIDEQAVEDIVNCISEFKWDRLDLSQPQL